MLLTRPNYVLIDYENVQALDLRKLNNPAVHVVLFIGANQKSVPTSLLELSSQMAERPTIITCKVSGKNALDFLMACHAGKLIERHPESFLHFLTKDKGFDALVEMLREQKRFAARADTLEELRFLADPAAQATPDLVHIATERLRATPQNTRPRKLKTLRSSLNSMFKKELSEARLDELVQALISAGLVLVDDKGTVTYGEKLTPVEEKQ